MKKVILSAGAFALAALSMVSCNSVTGSPKLNTRIDSVSYILGYAQGKSALQDLNSWPGDERVDIDLFVDGFVKGIKGDSTMTEDSCRAVLSPFFQELQAKARQEAEDKMQKEAEENKALGKLALDENRTKEGVKETASGLQYRVLKDGKGVKPKADDMVKVHYTGTLLDGTVFDSSVERNQPAEFQLSGVIPGWTEGLQLMNVGSKYEFLIPSDLAYGNRPAGPVIKPGSTLRFEVELLEILPKAKK